MMIPLSMFESCCPLQKCKDSNQGLLNIPKAKLKSKDYAFLLYAQKLWKSSVKLYGPVLEPYNLVNRKYFKLAQSGNPVINSVHCSSPEHGEVGLLPQWNSIHTTCSHFDQQVQ